MGFLKPQNLLLPLLLISFMATGIPVMQPVFWLNARWPIIGLVAILVAVSRFPSTVTRPMLVTFTLYAGWCVATTLWSEQPRLTISKSAAMVLVSLAGLRAGHLWQIRHETTRALDFLWPSAILSLFASFGGDAAVQSEGLGMLTGSTAGSNFLGFVVATSIPLVLWKIHTETGNKRLVWAGLLLASFYILYLTVSRGSYLVALGAISGTLLSRHLGRSTTAALFLGWTLLLLVLVAPAAADRVFQRNVVKSPISGGVLDSRQDNWNESYAAAQNGGWFGVGYGVSTGVDVEGGLALMFTRAYGREKGNSQFAIVEETGVIGLSLYVVLVVLLMRRLIIGTMAATGSQRILLGIITGTLLGMIMQSIVEAWWDGPGSTEFCYFWVMAGAGLAIVKTMAKQQTIRFRQSVVQSKLRRA